MSQRGFAPGTQSTRKEQENKKVWVRQVFTCEREAALELFHPRAGQETLGTSLGWVI